MKLDQTVAVRALEAPDTWIRRIPRSCTVYTLQGLIGKHFGLPPMQLRLVWETGEEDVVAHTYDNDSSSDDDIDTDGSDGSANEMGSKPSSATKQAQKKLREEILTPRMRALGTWADDVRSGEDGGAAIAMTLRVEWDGLCVERARRAAADVGTPMQTNPQTR